MNLGDRREPIFKDDADRQRFIETLGEVCANEAMGSNIDIRQSRDLWHGDWDGICAAPSGLVMSYGTATQGVALGWRIAPRWGWRRVGITRYGPDASVM